MSDRQTSATAPLVLGIETSCDETGIGIVRGTELLANVISSSMEQHARYGGVVPEIAARAHLEALTPALAAALAEAGVRLHDLDAIAVTSGPGLAGALMVGVGAAKALSVALDTPLFAVNHLVGHVGADVLREDGTAIELPTIALLVSGGHTSLLLVRDLISDVELLGETIDDAAGVELRIPPFALCTDNGAMIAALGAQLMMAGLEPSGLGFAADSTLPVTSIRA